MVEKTQTGHEKNQATHRQELNSGRASHIVQRARLRDLRRTWLHSRSNQGAVLRRRCVPRGDGGPGVARGRVSGELSPATTQGRANAFDSHGVSTGGVESTPVDVPAREALAANHCGDRRQASLGADGCAADTDSQHYQGHDGMKCEQCGAKTRIQITVAVIDQATISGPTKTRTINICKTCLDAIPFSPRPAASAVIKNLV